MAKNTENDQAKHDDVHSKHEGSSVGFYIFIALVLGAITYVEFALVEHQDTWFAALSSFWIVFLLVGLSVVKFVMVVMFFMHLQGDDRTFTGFFTSGMVIAAGTLLALSALFTVRSVAVAQTPQQEEQVQAETEEHEAEQEATMAHRFEYPAPKTLDVKEINLAPEGQILAGMSVVASGGPTQKAANSGGGRTAAGIPLAAPPVAVTLPDPFTQQPTQQPAAQQPAAPTQAAQQPAQTAAQDAAAPGSSSAADSAANGPLLTDADISAGEGIFTTNCVSCHQANGQGIPGAFPTLVGHAPELANADGGHEYMEKLLLYGLQGEINVSGQVYNGVMPAWAQLSDDDLANVLNYVLSSWGNADAMSADYPAFTADSVKAQRADNLSSQQVYELRQTLNLP